MSEPTTSPRSLRVRRIRITVLTAITVVLFAALFVLQAFDTLKFLRPDNAGQALIFFALSTLNFTAFVVLLMILGRNLIKLRREQQSGKLGARFRKRLVIFFIALSFLPVMFLFFAMRGYMSRSIDKWFSLPSDEILTTATFIETDALDREGERLEALATTLARTIPRLPAEQKAGALTAEALTHNLFIAGFINARAGNVSPYVKELAEKAPDDPKIAEVMQELTLRAQAGVAGHAEVGDRRANKLRLVVIASVPVAEQTALTVARVIAPAYVEQINHIRTAQQNYEDLKQRRRLIQRSSLQTFSLIALLVLFIAFWLAHYVGRTIADPVEKLAQATAHIRAGDLDYQAVVVGDDELATLARSFNEMTFELREHRNQLEERRRYIETILQSLSAGVISLDEKNNVTTINPAARQLLRLSDDVPAGSALESLLPEEQRAELGRMIRGAARIGSVTREVHFTLANQTPLDAAVTVSALHDPQGERRGAVIVLEDLSEMIEAQRRTAWSEVARRMAHEIKNPLTPIRLSAERLVKNLLGENRNDATGKLNGHGLTERQSQLIRECTSLIGTEVMTLQRMVDEFSTYARLPNAELKPAALNEVVASAVRLYHERLDGAQLDLRLADALPTVMIDAEQIKRVLVNLIDNALEAMSAQTAAKHIVIETRERADRDVVELTVSDSGPGIPAADRDKVFTPYFSTRKRGTGLGLAIVSHTIAEHHGRIRAGENLPHGARFTIELPLNHS
jgi:PAS domain S-box-containing protein